MNWTVVIVGLMTAGAAIGAQLVQAWATNRREDRVGRQRQWEARRDSFVGLLEKLDQADSLAEGGFVVGTGGHRGDKELGRALQSAIVTAEFFATPEFWSEMQPLVDAVQLRWNASHASVPVQLKEEAKRRLGELGADHEAGLLDLRRRFLEAARRDLDLTRAS